MGWLSDADDVLLAPALVLQRLSASNTEYSDTKDTFIRFVMTTSTTTTRSTATTDSASQPSEDEPTSTQVDDSGDNQATAVGDDDDLVISSIAKARRTVDGAGYAGIF